MSHATHLNESCHTYEWATSHMNDLCHTYEWVTSHFNNACHTYEWVMSHMNEPRYIWMKPVAFEWVTSHMNESRHTDCRAKPMEFSSQSPVSRFARFDIEIRFFFSPQNNIMSTYMCYEWAISHIKQCYEVLTTYYEHLHILNSTSSIDITKSVSPLNIIKSTSHRNVTTSMSTHRRKSSKTKQI